MSSQPTAQSLAPLEFFRSEGFISADEQALIASLFEPGFVFADALSIAESIHVQIKCDDVTALPVAKIAAQGVTSQRTMKNFHKFSFPGGLGVIFTSGPIAEEDLIPGAVTRDLPFVDHLGIDLREDSEHSRAIYDALPGKGTAAGWRHVRQGGPNEPVRGCSCEVPEKSWLYPPDGPDGFGRPIEFAFGELEVVAEDNGCDYRPIDPVHPLARLVPKVNATRAPQLITLSTRP
ncbi:hypothetical protein [Allorhizocola rhizosphaerae]|uniref:hypothetical protein n=1 Tax=Allorhizocola rhizosphaerae TaxID=1872709 RepID=UPI000E3B8883|nr:hypothetical protein [Allorhizocola rhizosphaerae]